MSKPVGGFVLKGFNLQDPKKFKSFMKLLKSSSFHVILMFKHDLKTNSINVATMLPIGKINNEKFVKYLDLSIKHLENIKKVKINEIDSFNNEKKEKNNDD